MLKLIIISTLIINLISISACLNMSNHTVPRSVPISPSILAKHRHLNGLSMAQIPSASISNQNHNHHFNHHNQPASKVSRIHYENYKALLGETVRLECPQANPTWFFRRVGDEAAANAGQEDLIVTRHGIINADYKYKIMCHVTLKHKVIVVNNIEFEDEGMYTCLYTMPNEKESFENNVNNNPVQYRFVFNVTVYSLINGLTMSVKLGQISKPQTDAGSSTLNNKKYSHDQFTELVENSLTLREGDEIYVNCVVENSKPIADIKLSLTGAGLSASNRDILSLNNNNFHSYLTLAPATTKNNFIVQNHQSIKSQQRSSIVSINTNTIKNNDSTFRTVLTARLKPMQEDHGKMITCKADNGFSNQKWEIKKQLNVLFAPVCKDPPRFVFYTGINQTLSVECRVSNANPFQVNYEWTLDNLFTRDYPLTQFQQSANLADDLSDMNYQDSFTMNKISFDQQFSAQSFPLNGQVNVALNRNSKMTNIINEGMSSRFKWRPTGMNDFGEVRCRASNEIGTTECVYEIKLGGVPNPPTECAYSLKNSSAIISCQVGFHQGDPDIYCYLLRKSDNGVYKEHTRNRESCSFIVNDVNANKLNEFWVYSSNKHGHNKDNGVYLTIGQNLLPVEKSSGKNIAFLGIAGAVCVFFLISCCFCYKLRKSSDDSDSVFENGDNYNSIKNGALHRQNSTDYPVKVLKGIRSENSYEPGVCDQKYIKLEITTAQNTDNNKNSKLEKNASFGNDDYFDSINRKIQKYALYDQQKQQQQQQQQNINNESTLGKISQTSSYDETKKPLIKDSVGLLTTVDQVNSITNTNKESSSSASASVSILNEPNLIMHNKMVTFSGSNHLGISKSHSKFDTTNKLKNQSATTLNTQNTSISTATTSASSASSASPTVSSIDAPSNEEEMRDANRLTVSDQSYSLSTNQTQWDANRPKQMSTFGVKSPKKFLNSNNAACLHKTMPSNVLYGVQSEFSESFVESSKYLNKLCEDIEVSLNVDSEVLDEDYSSNDFSGDYSFDNVYNKQGGLANRLPAKASFSSANSTAATLSNNSSSNNNEINRRNANREKSMNVDSDSLTSTNTSQLGVLV